MYWFYYIFWNYKNIVAVISITTLYKISTRKFEITNCEIQYQCYYYLSHYSNVPKIYLFVIFMRRQRPREPYTELRASFNFWRHPTTEKHCILSCNVTQINNHFSCTIVLLDDNTWANMTTLDLRTRKNYNDNFLWYDLVRLFSFQNACF